MRARQTRLGQAADRVTSDPPSPPDPGKGTDDGRASEKEAGLDDRLPVRFVGTAGRLRRRVTIALDLTGPALVALIIYASLNELGLRWCLVCGTLVGCTDLVEDFLYERRVYQTVDGVTALAFVLALASISCIYAGVYLLFAIFASKSIFL